MKIVTVHEAKTHLSQLIQEVVRGEEVIIARGKTPVVRLVVHEDASMERTPGTLPGLITHMADDFDAPLDDFQEYMQ